MVAIRCSSDTNHWMDGIIIIPRERLDETKKRLQERFADLWEQEGTYGDIIHDVAEEYEYALCDYDETTDEPTKAWEAYCNSIYRQMEVIEMEVY